MKRSTDELITMIRRRSRRLRPLPTTADEQGRLPRKPRAVLFDVYGTLLVRVGDAHPRAAQKRRDIESLVRRRHLPTPAAGLEARLQEAIAQEHSTLRARGNEHPEVSIERIWAGLFPELAPRELRSAIVEYELAAHPAWPMPGCRGLLRALAQSGVALGIVSNAQFYTPIFLMALLGASLEELGFVPSLCVYSADVGSAKPGRVIFDLAAQRLRTRALRVEEAVMVGNDHGNDVVPAARSGLMTVHAALDRRSYAPPRDGEERAKPDAVVRRLSSLEVIVAGAR
jgi:putative hydrolase of the HAD superfamily